MAKIRRNAPCPCGSGRKYKKCCINKRSRKTRVMFRTDEPIHAVHFDKETMSLTAALTNDDRLIEIPTAFSETYYTGESGKEKVTGRIQDKVIPDVKDLLRHLSTFDLIIGIDTNTKTINSEEISATGIIHCRLTPAPGKPGYNGTMQMPGFLLFRNCPKELHPEKLAWMNIINRFNRNPDNRRKRFTIVTDHDLGNHIPFNERQTAIFKDFYMPDNSTLMYGRGDGSTDSILNDLIKRCDKRSTEILNCLEKDGLYKDSNVKISFDQIPEIEIGNGDKHLYEIKKLKNNKA